MKWREQIPAAKDPTRLELAVGLLGLFAFFVLLACALSKVGARP
jgi:hypothetical protein